MPLIRKTLPEQPPLPATSMQVAAAALQTGTVDERWMAARDLAQFAGALPVLGQALDTEADGKVREAIFTSLARINSHASFDIVLAQLAADDAQLRTAALDTMRLMPEIASARLDALLHDPDADIRILACDLARSIPAAAHLLGLLTGTDPALNVCAAAVDGLADIGTAAELAALAFCATRFPAEPFLIFSIKAASARIQSRAVPPNA